MNKLNKKIEKFVEEHDMEVMGHNISSEFGIFLGRFEPSCSYEQFLETIALRAIVEAEKVADLLDDLEEENYYRELSEDALADEI